MSYRIKTRIFERVAFHYVHLLSPAIVIAVRYVGMKQLFVHCMLYKLRRSLA